MTTIALVCLMGMMALVADVGNVYFQYNKLQNASDLAALAGAQSLPFQIVDAVNSARTYALSNGMQSAEISAITVASDAKSITVKGTRIIPSTFAAVLGLKQFTVKSTSVAGIQPAGSNVFGAWPVGLDDTTSYNYGQTIVMHNGGAGPGNWGAIALGATGGTVYSNNLINGYSGSLSVGDSVPTEPGGKVGPTDAGVATRIADAQLADPTGVWNSYTPNDGRAVIIPLVDWSSAAGRSSVTITGFCEVWIVSASGPDITAIFIGQSGVGQASPGIPDRGIYHVALIQ